MKIYLLDERNTNTGVLGLTLVGFDGNLTKKEKKNSSRLSSMKQHLWFEFQETKTTIGFVVTRVRYISKKIVEEKKEMREKNLSMGPTNPNSWWNSLETEKIYEIAIEFQLP